MAREILNGSGAGLSMSAPERLAGSVGVQVISNSGTVKFQGTIDGTNWVDIQATDRSTGTAGTSTTGTGIFLIDVTGLDRWRVNATAGSAVVQAEDRIG